LPRGPRSVTFPGNRRKESNIRRKTSSAGRESGKEEVQEKFILGWLEGEAYLLVQSKSITLKRYTRLRREEGMKGGKRSLSLETENYFLDWGGGGPTNGHETHRKKVLV